MPDSEWVVCAADAGVRLDKYLAAPGRLGSRSKAFAGLERGKVFLDGAEAGVAEAAMQLAEGQTVRVWMDRPGSAQARRPHTAIGDLLIVFEDDALLVVNKPAGLLSVPLERKADAPSVYEQIEDHFRPFGKRRPFVVHRIDQDTSGLVVFAKDARAQSQLQSQFKRREPRRIYLAVVYGHPEPAAGIWRNHLVWDEKALIQKETHPRDRAATEAISEYLVLESFRETALLEVRLQTGRRNQIRIQARLHGHHWSARSGTPTVPRRGARSSSSGTRCTRTSWRSIIRPAAGRWRSARHRPPTSWRCWNGCVADGAALAIADGRCTEWRWWDW